MGVWVWVCAVLEEKFHSPISIIIGMNNLILIGYRDYRLTLEFPVNLTRNITTNYVLSLLNCSFETHEKQLCMHTYLREYRHLMSNDRFRNE